MSDTRQHVTFRDDRFTRPSRLPRGPVGLSFVRPSSSAGTVLPELVQPWNRVRNAWFLEFRCHEQSCCEHCVRVSA